MRRGENNWSIVILYVLIFVSVNAWHVILPSKSLAFANIPASAITGQKAIRENNRTVIEWEVNRAVVAQASQRSQIREIKAAITISGVGEISRVMIDSGARCGAIAGECLISQLTNNQYKAYNFDQNARITVSQPINDSAFGIFSPDYQRFRLVDSTTVNPVTPVYTITLYYQSENPGSPVGYVAAKTPPITFTVQKGSVPGGLRKDTKEYYDQFFNQSCSTAVSGTCSTFRDLSIQDNRCRNLDTGKDEEGEGFWLYIPAAIKQAANLAVDRRPGICLRLSKVIKYRGAIYNGATDTWNAFYFSAQNTPSEITNLFTNGIFTARLDDSGPDCPQAIRILERGCPTFALSVSLLSGSESSSLFENNAVKAYITVSQNTYFAMINKLYKPDGSGPYSKDHLPQSDNLADEALKKYKINTASSGDNPGASTDTTTTCTSSLKGFWQKLLIGKAICGTLEVLGGFAFFLANLAFSMLIYASGLQ